MKAFILLLVSCLSVAAADTGVRLFTSTSTDAATGAFVTTETYARDGQTDLVRITKSQNGAVIYRSHGFYHAEKLVALFSWEPDSSTFNVVAATPYYVGLRFTPSHEIRSLTIRGNDFMDGFYTTNGVFYPAPDSDVQIKPVK
ncbi:MAG TPA: hypothetical protein VMH87_06405 [Pseudomonadales bacterium]|nr:hypothetical protein [Pseudomonadales bacterium]